MAIFARPSLDSKIKQPAESDIYDFDFSALLKTGETIVSVVGNQVTQAKAGLVANADDLTIGTPSDDGAALVQVRVSGGSHGEDYVLTCLVTTSSGNTKETEGVLQVRDWGRVG